MVSVIMTAALDLWRWITDCNPIYTVRAIDSIVPQAVLFIGLTSPVYMLKIVNDSWQLHYTNETLHTAQIIYA